MLVTNDFPPKTGGIQSYLWELWRRLPPASFSVMTLDHPRAFEFDRGHRLDVERLAGPMLLPTPGLVRKIRAHARDRGASLVLLDPVFPLGLVGPSLGVPYGIVAHGAELTVPGRLPVTMRSIARVLAGAELVVTSGQWAADQVARVSGHRATNVVSIPPGVDNGRFRPLDAVEKRAARRQLGLPEEGRLIVSVSRLVPRKGIDVVIEAADALHRQRRDLAVAIGGEGRLRKRLERLASGSSVPVEMLGPVHEELLPRLYGAADVFAIPCRRRWGGLEQEGYGIVFLEAAAAGVAAVAGDSGGASEAVQDGVTGAVVERPGSPVHVAAALAALLDDEQLRSEMGRRARARAVECSDHGVLVDRLARLVGLDGILG